MRQFSIIKTVSVPANTTTSNLLAGTRLAPVINNGALSLYTVADAVGVEQKLQVQSTEILDAARVSGANRFPEMDKDGVVANVVCGKGEQVAYTLTNTTGAAISVTYKLVFMHR